MKKRIISILTLVLALSLLLAIGAFAADDLKDPPTMSTEDTCAFDPIIIKIEDASYTAKITGFKVDGKAPDGKFDDLAKITAEGNLEIDPSCMNKPDDYEVTIIATGYEDAVVDVTIVPNAIVAPYFSLKTGTYATEQSVKITSSVKDVVIYYTTDGTYPEYDKAKEYKGEAIKVSKTTTLKAVSYKVIDDNPLQLEKSDPVSVTLTFAVPAPVISPSTTSISGSTSVAITCTEPSAKIYYTLDGTDPTAASKLFSAPFNVTVEDGKKVTVKAIAIVKTSTSTDIIKSEIAKAEYTYPGVGSMDNFQIKTSYARGQFTDVDETLWYGFDKDKVIAEACKYGMMVGNSATTFNPQGDLTVAEAITIAARMHSIYLTGADNFVLGSTWYQVFVDYAIANNIMKSGDFDSYTRAATRAEMVYLFSRALPESCYAERTDTVTPPDVNSTTKYEKEILFMYKAGILVGSDDVGTFHATNKIIRAEVSAIATRVILPDTRLGTL